MLMIMRTKDEDEDEDANKNEMRSQGQRPYLQNLPSALPYTETPYFFLIFDF